ncbi:zinc finger protein gcs1 [Aureobasidium pullulans]|nr:zinc finger protein gcs1 [Aureobasidium pullulans]
MSNKMWEVDPETKSKLLDIQKTNENNRCVDCGAPSPQWASPKFGIFFCLSCSGTHRSLGVHISFVRSITMDSFKVQEVERMSKGGNRPWKDFFDSHESNTLQARTFDECTIQERYDSDAGEEWKERLTAKVEDKEYVPGTKSSAMPARAKPATSASTSRSQTPLGASSAGPPTQKVQNEAYFARMGAENAHRPDSLPPNQGGKYAGFGSDPTPSSSSASASIPGVDDFQKDPVAALTKGFGWLSSTVTKQAKTGYDGWVKPNMQKLAEADLAAQARMTAAQLGQGFQTGTKAAAENFNRFVEGDERLAPKGGAKGPAADKRDFWDSFGEPPQGPANDKKDFWDDFAAAGETATQKKAASSSIGTSAMKKPTSGSQQKSGDDAWGDW